MSTAPPAPQPFVPPPRPPATWRTWTGWPRRIALGLAFLLVAAPGLTWAAYTGCFTTVCVSSNYMSAVSTLRSVQSAQAQARAAAAIDEDGDGRGECGSFREMSGAVHLRGTSAVLDPPVLSGAFRTLTKDLSVARSGYRFRIYLRRPDGLWTNADAPHADVDPSEASRGFLCVAWPATYGMSGTYTFAADETGAIVQTDNSVYGGATGPPPSAAPRTSEGLAAGWGADGGAWTWVCTPGR